MGIRVPGVIEATDIDTLKGLTGIIYGNPGVGKTELAAGAARVPYGRRVLYIETEGGQITLAGLEDIDIKRIKTWKEVEDLHNWLTKNLRDLDYRTIVIDTFTNLQRLGLDSLLDAKNADLAQIQDYGKSNEQIGRMARRFVDLADVMTDPKTGEHYGGLNIFFICHASEAMQKQGEETRLVIRPTLTPRATETVSGIVDMLAYVTKTPGSKKRFLAMTDYKTALGKLRQPPTRPTMPTKMLIPDTRDGNGVYNMEVIPALARILQHIHGDINLNDRDKYPELFALTEQQQEKP